MLTKLSLRFLDRVPKEDHDKILKDRFFYGIKSELRISIRHLYDDDSVTFSQLLVKAHRNEEEESASWIINKKMTMENDSTLEQQVDRLIAKSSNQYQAHIPQPRGIIVRIMVDLLSKQISSLRVTIDKLQNVPQGI